MVHGLLSLRRMKVLVISENVRLSNFFWIHGRDEMYVGNTIDINRNGLLLFGVAPSLKLAFSIALAKFVVDVIQRLRNHTNFS